VHGRRRAARAPPGASRLGRRRCVGNQIIVSTTTAETHPARKYGTILSPGLYKSSMFPYYPPGCPSPRPRHHPDAGASSCRERRPGTYEVTRSRSVNSTAAPTRSPTPCGRRRRSTGPRRLRREKRPRILEVAFGIAKLDAINRRRQRRLTADEMSHIINDAQAKVVVVGPSSLRRSSVSNTSSTPSPRSWRLQGHDAGATTRLGRHPTADDPGVVSPADDIAFSFFTSGTTGLPKGAMMTQRGFFPPFSALDRCLDDNLGPLRLCRCSFFRRFGWSYSPQTTSARPSQLEVIPEFGRHPHSDASFGDPVPDDDARGQDRRLRSLGRSSTAGSPIGTRLAEARCSLRLHLSCTV